MNTDTDTLLAERFAATFDETNDRGDWNEVVRLAHSDSRRHRRVIALAVCLGLVVVAAASAIVFGRSTVDFLKASKAPEAEIVDFGSMGVGAPPGMAPGVLPNQSRRITSVSIDGKQHILYVAPTRAGGFCLVWTGFVGGCRATRGGHFGVGVTGSARPPDVVTAINGTFFQSGGTRLEVRFADGTSAEIPFIWVTKPIDAGFYIYRIPDANRTPSRRPTSVTLYNSHGNAITRAPIQVPPFQRQITHHLPGYAPISVPAQAIYAKRQQLFEIKIANGHRIGLWIAPQRGGGTCMWSNSASDCALNGALAARSARNEERLRKQGKPKTVTFGPPDFPNLGGGNPVTLCCKLNNKVARIELRFQDDARIELTPREHYLLAVISPSYYPQGHRLDEMIAYTSAGHVLARKTVDPNVADEYPCTKPKRRYGITVCP